MVRQHRLPTPSRFVTLLILVLLALFLASCNVTVQTGAPAGAQDEATVSVQDQVATSVAATLAAQTAAETPASATSEPASTQPPASSPTSASPTASASTTVPPTATPEPPTATPAPPTDTPAPPPPTPTPLTLPTIQPLVTVVPQVTLLPMATATPTLAPMLTVIPQLTVVVPMVTPIPTLPPAARICDPPPATSFQAILNNHPALAADLGCPTSQHPQITPEAWQVQSAYEPFQHGAMLWSNKIGWYDQPVIYVMFSNGSYQRFDDTFNASVDPESGGETPPSGLYEPIRGFGKVWRNNPSVRNALGWATAPEAGGPGRFQIMEGGEMIWSGATNHTYVFDRVGGKVWSDFNVPFQP